VRGRFHERRAAEQRIAATAEALRRIETLSTAVGRRQAAGDASGYDRGRLERERASIAARAAVEGAGLARARARLGGLLGGEDAPAVTGELLPAGAPPALEGLTSRVTSRPDLRALSEEVEAGSLDVRAGARAWIPELTLSGGYKGSVVQDERLTGFAVGVSVPFPLFDRGQDEALRGSGRARAARARLALETDAASAEVRGLHAQASVLAEAAHRFRAEALEPSRRLITTADAAYRGGELGILELVDAHRGALDAELQALELDLTARRARLDLDLATGGTSR
jgi:cobalt-zinc-cadmium efflux system outer membrane protein